MTYQIYGGPASPYSMKIRAVFRYLRLPHTWLVPMDGFTGEGGLGEGAADSTLAAAGKGVVPVVRFPDGAYHADSTPMMIHLSELVPARSLVHPHPGIAFLSHFIEDMADEFLPRCFFLLRWTTDADWCGRRQMIGWNGAMSDSELEPLARAFTERQQAMLGPGAASIPLDQVQQAYEEVLRVLDGQLQRSLFLFGSRPSLAEFGLHGQMTQYAGDPLVGSVMKDKAVRVFQWQQFMDDLSGLEGEWAAPEDCLTDELAGIMACLAKGYLSNIPQVDQTIEKSDLARVLNGPRYTLRCLLALKSELAGLAEDDRELIRPMLETTGAWDALQFRPGEEAYVVPIEMA
ncbi:MAG: glutathione S-transferase family protein [Pseudomonadota bacterium]